MIPMKERAVALAIAANRLGKHLPFDVCLYICSFNYNDCVGSGKSSYARKRRARSIRRCHRCFRVRPGFYFTTRCDGVSCKPGISYPIWVELFIRFGIPKSVSTSGTEERG
uniref:RNA silencing suppressor n=1 Tax=Pepper virus A TaxID=1803898 RepID=A0A6G5VXU0_9VIRU|nr:cysteine rich protein [Pepper virus A]